MSNSAARRLIGWGRVTTNRPVRALPIDPILPAIGDALRSSRTLVLEAGARSRQNDARTDYAARGWHRG